MILDVSKLEIGTTRIERSYEASAIPFDFRGFTLGDPWLFKADINKNSREEITIHGVIKGTVHLACDRCLESFDLEIEQSFTQYLVPSGRLLGHADHELQTVDLDENCYDDPQISLADLINEQIILTLPIKLLCNPDCQGLCQKCGSNLNQGPCSCQTLQTDPRFLMLKEMKKRAQDK